MSGMFEKINKKRELGFLAAGLCMILILLFLPTGYEGAQIYTEAVRCRVEVLSTDESSIVSSGLIQSGEQLCQVRVLNGELKGRELRGVNMLSGSLESDKIYQPGDRALAVISVDSQGNPTNVVMSDYYRIDKEVVLAAIFILLLILVAGMNGFRAIFSFIISILLIWKVLIPLYLKGHNPIFIGLLVTVFLTVMIIFFVYGFDRRSLGAISGSLMGTLTTCVIGILFTDVFKIHGAVMSNSESLLYAGYQHLDLTAIFMSSIFIGASGAMMDLAVDITSAINEVVEKKPGIGWREAFVSGMNVARAAMGTMTTTLLLAYSGGYVALLMVFMAQGTPVTHILNYKYVASEILDTMVGSLGLVTVAPFTAALSGFVLTRRNTENVGEKECKLQERS